MIFLGLGLSLSVVQAQYSYQAWSLDSRDFTEWYFSQSILPLGENWLRKWYARFPEGHLRSLCRLTCPIGFLAGVAMVGVGLMVILAPLFTT